MNKYEIIKDVGVGTFGTVYEAINKTDDEFINEIEDKIEKSVECHKVSDVKVLMYESSVILLTTFADTL